MDKLLDTLKALNTDDIEIDEIKLDENKIIMIKNRNYIYLFYKNNELKLYYSELFNKKYLSAKLIDLLFSET